MAADGPALAAAASDADSALPATGRSDQAALRPSAARSANWTQSSASPASQRRRGSSAATRTLRAAPRSLSRGAERPAPPAAPGPAPPAAPAHCAPRPAARRPAAARRLVGPPRLRDRAREGRPGGLPPAPRPSAAPGEACVMPRGSATAGRDAEPGQLRPERVKRLAQGHPASDPGRRAARLGSGGRAEKDAEEHLAAAVGSGKGRRGELPCSQAPWTSIT